MLNALAAYRVAVAGALGLLVPFILGLSRMERKEVTAWAALIGTISNLVM